MVADIIEDQNLLEKLDGYLKNNTVAIGIFLGATGHIALFGKINHSLYIIDPQSGEQLSMDDPNIGLYLFKFNIIQLVTSTSGASHSSGSSPKTRLKRNSHMYTIKQRIRANPTSNTLRWTRYVLHHRDLKPQIKYKIIKKPNKEVQDSVFLRFEGPNAMFEDITVPTAQHFFIEIKSRTRARSFSRSRRSRRSRSKHSF